MSTPDLSDQIPDTPGATAPDRPLPHALWFLAAVVLLGDYLTWDTMPGSGIAWAGLTLLLAVGAVARGLPHLRRAGVGLLLVWVVVIALAQFWNGSSLALLLAPWALGCLTLAVVPGRVGGLTGLLGRVVVAALVTPLQALRELSGNPWRRSTLALLVRSWLLPVLLVSGFALLLGVANPVIALWRDTVWAALTTVGIPEPLRIVWWWLLAFLALAVARAARAAGVTDRSPIAPVTTADHTRLAIRFLLLANALFAVQHLLDLRYLFAGAALPEGLTYASYAHRGSYTLIATALLAAGIILLWFRPGSTCCRDRGARLLVLAWLGQNALLVAAAGWRLAIYVDAYGLTEWRIAAGLWMLLVGSGLLAIAWRIVHERDNRWLIDAVAAALAVLLTGTTLIDCDALIAWHNVQHCREVGSETIAVDLDYLAQLSPTGAPALAWLATASRDPEVARHALEISQQQQEYLAEWQSDWRQWTVVAWLSERGLPPAKPHL